MYIDPTPRAAVAAVTVPQLLQAKRDARKLTMLTCYDAGFARAIDAGKSFTVIPWSMGIAARVLRVMPNWLYDRVFSRMPRKPR